MYLSDPVGALRRVADHVRPGGALAFQEWTAMDPILSLPHAPLWESTFDLLVEVFRRAGTEMEMGLKLHPSFVAAGLPALRAERPVGGGPGYPGYQWLAGMVRSTLPAMERLGLATAEEVDIGTLHERLRDEVAGLGGVIAFPSFVGARARKYAEPANRAGRPVSPQER
jgi:hypothetical protein